MSDNIVASQIGSKPISDIKKDIRNKVAETESKKKKKKSSGPKGPAKISDPFATLNKLKKQNKARKKKLTFKQKRERRLAKNKKTSKEDVVKSLQENNLNLIASQVDKKQKDYDKKQTVSPDVVHSSDNVSKPVSDTKSRGLQGEKPSPTSPDGFVPPPTPSNTVFDIQQPSTQQKVAKAAQKTDQVQTKREPVVKEKTPDTMQRWTREDTVKQITNTQTTRNLLGSLASNTKEIVELRDQKESIDPDATYEYTDDQTGETITVSGQEAKELLQEQIDDRVQYGKEATVSAVSNITTGQKSARTFLEQTTDQPKGTTYVIDKKGTISPDYTYVSKKEKINMFKEKGTVTVTDEKGKEREMPWKEFKTKNPAAYVDVDEKGNVNINQDYVRWNEERYKNASPLEKTISQGAARFLGGLANYEYIIATVGQGDHKRGDEIIAEWEFKQQQNIKNKNVVGFATNIPVVTNVLAPAGVGAVVGGGARLASKGMDLVANKGYSQVANTVRNLGRTAAGVVGTEIAVQEGYDIAVRTPDDKKLERVLTSGTQFASFGAGFKAAQDYKPKRMIAQQGKDKVVVQDFVTTIRGKPVGRVGKPKVFGQTPTGPTKVVSPVSKAQLRKLDFKTPKDFLKGLQTGGSSARGNLPVVSSGTKGLTIKPNMKPTIPKSVNVVLTKDTRNIPSIFEPVGETGITMMRPKKPAKILTPVEQKNIIPKVNQKPGPGGSTKIEPLRPAKELTPIDSELKIKDEFPGMKRKPGPVEGSEVLIPKQKPDVLTPLSKRELAQLNKGDVSKMKPGPGGSNVITPKSKPDVLTPLSKRELAQLNKGDVSRMKPGPGGSSVITPKQKAKTLTPGEIQKQKDMFPNLEKVTSESGISFMRPKKKAKILTEETSFEQYQRSIKEKDVFSQKGPLSTKVLPKPTPFGKYVEPPFYGSGYLETGVTPFAKKPTVKLRATPKKKGKIVTLRDLQKQKIISKDSDFKGLTTQGQKQVSILKPPKTKTVSITKMKNKELTKVTKNELRNIKKDTRKLSHSKKKTKSIFSPEYKVTAIRPIMDIGRSRGKLPSVFKGLKIPERIKTSFDVKTKKTPKRKISVTPKTKDLTKVDQSLGLKQKSGQKQTSAQEVTQLVGSDVAQTQASAMDVLPTQGSRQVRAQQQGQLPFQGMKTTTKLKTDFLEFEYGGLYIPPKKKKQNNKLSQGNAFYVETKVRQQKGGKSTGKKGWRKIKDKPLSRADALALGAHTVSNNPKASFRIVPTDKEPQKLRKKLEPFFMKQHQFYQKNGNVFVEKTHKRIDSPGELRGITRLGVRARRAGKGNRKLRRRR